MTKPDWAERLQRTFARKFNEGVKFENERIIKLLESDAGQKIMCLECSDELIALINGENK